MWSLTLKTHVLHLLFYGVCFVIEQWEILSLVQVTRCLNARVSHA